MDEATFVAKLDRLYTALLAAALARLRHRQDAEDCVQHTLLALWRNRAVIRQDDIEGYAFRTLYNKTIDILRTRQRRSGRELDKRFGWDNVGTGDTVGEHEDTDPDDLPIAYGEPPMAPEDAVLYAETVAEVTAIINAHATLKQRIALAMAEQGRSMAEIGAALDVDGDLITAAKQALYRGRKAIRPHRSPEMADLTVPYR